MPATLPPLSPALVTVERGRLLQFLHPLIALSTLFGLLYVGAALTFGDRRFVVAAVLAGVLVAACARARSLAVAGRSTASAMTAGAGLLFIALTFSFIFPFVFPTLAMMPIAAVALVLPFAQGRPLLAFCGTSVAVGLASTLISRFVAPPILMPRWLEELILIGTMSVSSSLTMVLLWQFSSRLRTVLRDTEAAVQARDDFLSIASHELKTPVAALSLSVGGLSRATRALEQDPGEQVRERVRRVERQLGRLDHLVDRLLDVSNLRGAGIELHPTDVDLVRVLRSLADEFAEEAARAKCPLTLTLAETLPAFLDAQRVEQIVANLLTNALKYGAGKPIVVGLSRSEGDARLWVEDLGIGIAEADRERIFGRFERAVSSKNYGGLGLGLWLSRSLAEAMGARLEVKSELGRGSTFTLVLPLPAARAAG